MKVITAVVFIRGVYLYLTTQIIAFKGGSTNYSPSDPEPTTVVVIFGSCASLVQNPEFH